jgi:hypothetical protein
MEAAGSGRPGLGRSPLSTIGGSKLVHEIQAAAAQNKSNSSSSNDKKKRTTTDVEVFSPPINKEAVPAPRLSESRHRLAAVAGTSTCYVVNTPGPEGQFVPGVWGPYKDVVFPGWWMNEGGQSSTGQLIEFMITEHHAYNELKELCEQRGEVMYDVLHDLLLDLQEQRGVSSFTELTKDLHFYPDLHGRSSSYISVPYKS